jgi:CHASE2 domain-containing sensor protein
MKLIDDARAAVVAVLERSKDPTSYSWLTYAWVVLWSVLGGIVSWYGKIKAGAARPFNLAELLGEIATSAFAGVTTFYLCEWAHLDPLLSAVFIGIAGHMGTRFVFFMERVLEKHMTNKLGLGGDK